MFPKHSEEAGKVNIFNVKSMAKYLFVLELGNQGSNMRFQRDTDLIDLLDELVRLLSCTDTRRSFSNDDCAGGDGCALGKEADELGDGEDHVTDGS